MASEQLIVEAISMMKWVLGGIGGLAVVVIGAAFRIGGTAHQVERARDDLREVRDALKQIPELVTAVRLLQNITGKLGSDHRELRDETRDNVRELWRAMGRGSRPDPRELNGDGDDE